MLYIFIFHIFVLAISGEELEENAHFLKSSHEGTERLKQAMNNLHRRFCPEYEEKFEVAKTKFHQCSDRVDRENDLTTCDAVQKYLKNCSTPLLDTYHECLPEKSKDLPEFVLVGILSLHKMLCDKMDGEEILELFNPCFTTKSIHIRKCKKMFKKHMRKYDKNVPMRTEICEAAQDFRPCLKDHIHASCESPITREAFIKVYDAIFKPCREQSTPQ